jgi:AAA+ superfamily predicted ATPase
MVRRSLGKCAASAARIRALVDKAATYAAADKSDIEERHLRRALGESGGKDRPLVHSARWEDVIVEPEVAEDLRTLMRQLNATRSRVAALSAPTGVLLVGPPGTGKTMIGQLISTQTRRSVYPLSAADVLGGQVGASVGKRSLLERKRLVRQLSSSTKLTVSCPGRPT